MRAITALAVAALVLGGSLFLARDSLILHLPGLIDGWRDPVGPTRELRWDQGPDAPAVPVGERPPNIVLILADDMGFNDVSFWGGGPAGGTAPTPHIDSIGHNGVAFSAGYAGHATCAPSRAALLSGRYATRFGYEFTPVLPAMMPILNRLNRQQDRIRYPLFHSDRADDVLPYEVMGMPSEELSLAELLGQAGYYTAHVGKWHLGLTNGMDPNSQGFDDSLRLASGKYLPDDHPQTVNARQDFDPIDRFLWATMKHAASFNDSPRFAPPGYVTDYYSDEAVRIIEQNRHRPFFLFLAHFAPHNPLQALKSDYDALSHIDDHRLRVYAAVIRALDRSVGRVLEALRANGLEENTLVVFTSDNGGAGYLGLPDINSPYRGWKSTFFEGGIRVPLFLQWPGALTAGAVYTQPVHHLDLYATAAAAAGLSPPDDRPVDGVNLLPYLRGEQDGAPHGELIWRSGHYQAVIAGSWKLQLAARPDKTWLFHLDEDPTEQRNLAAMRPDKVQELRAILAAHNAEQQAPAWPSLIEGPVMIDKTRAEPEAIEDEYVYWPN